MPLGVVQCILTVAPFRACSRNHRQRDLRRRWRTLLLLLLLLLLLHELFLLELL